jgi:hypothetical protein
VFRPKAFDIIGCGTDRLGKNFDFAENFVLLCILFPASQIVKAGNPSRKKNFWCSAMALGTVSYATEVKLIL